MSRRSGSGLPSWPKILKKLYNTDTDRLLREYVAKIAEKYPASTIVLFGSRARGQHLPFSDYDVAVVMRKADDKIRIVEELYKHKPKELPLDVIIIEVSELQDPLVQNMLKNCLILYDGLGLLEHLPCRNKSSKS